MVVTDKLHITGIEEEGLAKEKESSRGNKRRVRRRRTCNVSFTGWLCQNA